jgi:hypothetical protein
LLVVAALKNLPAKIWHSLRLGLVPISNWVWAIATAAFWIAYERHRTGVAWGSLASAAAVSITAYLIGKASTSGADRRGTGLLDPDLPVAEGGEDLLGREGMIESLVSTILLEPPAVIAVTGGYGDGKTSFLNLAIGELRKSREIQVPIIVRFSPWLAGDSNALVLSLLNSIVAEVRSNYVVPGLSADAARYARALLSAIPWTERLKDVISEPSQEGRIDALVNRVAKIRNRVLVVLDDLDRVEAEELETVFKILRGSDTLSNVTFLCVFDKKEVALVLKKTRPQQDTPTFIEKFFPLEFHLPEIGSDELQRFFSEGLARVLTHHALSYDDLTKSVERIWEGGGGQYFRNLRRVKLFLNKIGRSLQLIGGEVNVEDFIKLELIRDIEPALYDRIYRDHSRFWNQNFAFEARFRDRYLREEDAKKERTEYYERVRASIEQKPYVLQLLEDLFPQFAMSQRRFGLAAVDAVKAEKDKRIFHPRYFRQYFLLKVPSELFPQKEFTKFLSSVRREGEDEAAERFSTTYRSLVNEDFKRWHFMNLIDIRFDEFDSPVARGLCRGMARNSSPWPTDDFRALIAVRSTLTALKDIAGSDARSDFLRKIIGESASDLYTLSLVWQLRALLEDPSQSLEGQQFRAVGFSSPEAEPVARILSDLDDVKECVREQLRNHYLVPDAPSVFEQYGKVGMGGIAPNYLMIAWRRLGPDAEADQRVYLRDLFARRPQDLNEFLKLMFRADFIDDYTALAPLIDYSELAELIAQNESILDPERVQKFRKRYNAESSVVSAENADIPRSMP